MCQDCNPQAPMCAIEQAKLELGSSLAAARIAADQVEGLQPHIIAATALPRAQRDERLRLIAAKLRGLVTLIKTELYTCEKARATLGLAAGRDPRD